MSSKSKIKLFLLNKQTNKPTRAAEGRDDVGAMSRWTAGAGAMWKTCVLS